MAEAAGKLKGSTTEDAQLETAREMMLAGGASMVYHFMSDDDVHRIMKHPFVGFASDSGVLTPGAGVPHPRGYGNNARVLGEYVRVRKVISLEEAIRKMTSLPAQHFRFTDRGLIKEGYAADLVLFDARTVADAATFEKPHAYATGIPYVLVNGVMVVKNGEHTGATPGALLRSVAPRLVSGLSPRAGSRTGRPARRAGRSGRRRRRRCRSEWQADPRGPRTRGSGGC